MPGEDVTPKLIPIANPMLAILEGGWSRPVQVRVENGEFVFRALHEARGGHELGRYWLVDDDDWVEAHRAG